MANARFVIKNIELYERPVTFRLPFRYGIVTLTEAPQVFIKIRIESDDKSSDKSTCGIAAELLAPKWFDKNTELTNEENFNQLRRSLYIAREGYLSYSATTAFELFAAHYPEQVKRCAGEGLNPLVASYGTALLDRAILDAVCRLNDISLEQAIKTNIAGVQPADLAPDLAGFDMEVFLASLIQWPSIFARHTVGLTDALTMAEVSKPLNDGLPETLEQAIQFYGYRYFKLKLAGDASADLERLKNIATILDSSEQDYYVTLDGNEQYASIEDISALWQSLVALPALQRFCQSILLIEQPLNRQIALQQDVSALSSEKPMIIDESDAELDSFVQAKALGYRGVSSKSCKGIYRSLINAARCAHWNHEERAHYFLSAEDLSTQAGIALQQDLAVACLLGIEHIERNGHFYVSGFPKQNIDESQAFLQAHNGLYCQQDGQTRLQIIDGKIDTSSLHGVGFARAAEPDWSTMSMMEDPKD